MSNVNIFEKASRAGLRFTTSKGMATADDLWNLPLTSTGNLNLDDIARSISAKIKESEVESFVHKSTKANDLEKLRLDIVKRIIEVKLEENETRKNAKENEERKRALLQALSNKKAESLTKMTEAEIEAELNKL